MTLPGVALLGPLTVNGDSAVLAPRDRVVLAALAMQPGELMSAERLADALWGERPPASWHKVVPGCIVRLRRLLGAEAIETTRYGYRLVVPVDEVDTHRFERLLQRGRELLEVGESERAQHALGEALELWRGPPLMDLDGWEPARIEAERLTELRLETEECQLDAALRAGRHAEVSAQAKAAVARAPLRERRWSLLALAQYQSGRQGEALRTLHQARTVLVTELGLDPGPDLIALERAILRQDPALTVPPAGPDAAAVCPYLGLFCYDIDDAEMFFGRDAEVADCVRRLGSAGMLAVVGPSGSGKSSLVRAGVAAALVRAGRHPFVVTAGSRPTAVLTDAPPTPEAGTVLVVDQFEEAFTLCADPEERTRFFSGLVAEASSSPVVISLRADRLGALAQYPDIARLVERGLYLLGPMDEAGLRAAITGPAQRAGLLLEPGLVDLLVREVEGQPGALPLLSHALRRTWERREGRTLTVAGYQATGGIRGCVAQSAEQLYESLTTRQRPVLRQVLLRLVSAADDGDPVRTRVPRRLLLTDPEREYVVDRLVAARLVTTDDDTVQIAHESLTRAWPRLSTWLDDDVEGQRVLRHLSASADAWDSMGRPDSELYRGSRLTQALDWQHSSHPDLTPTESDYLDAGASARDAERLAATEHAQHQARARRRTRLLITGVAALLVAALVAGVLAMRQQRQREAADLAAAVAEASRIDDSSRAAPNVDQALLLALEAYRLNDSPSTRRVVANLLSGHAALIRSVPTQDAVQTLAASPDGTTLLVGEGDSGTMAYRTDTFDRTATYAAVPGWTIGYRADGQQLLLAGRSGTGLGESAGALSAAVTDPRMSVLNRLELTEIRTSYVYAEDAAFSANGRALAVYADGFPLDGGPAIDSAVAVWRVGTLSRHAMLIKRMPSFAVGLSPDGRLLYVGTQEPALRVIDVATGRTLKSVPLPPTLALAARPADVDKGETIWSAFSDDLEVSPDGKTLAVAEGNDVVLYDAATLAVRQRLTGHTDLVRSLRFSHDGTRLAAGSQDHNAIVWDLVTGGAIDTLAGHGDTVLGVAFSPDDGTLYTGGPDRHVLVWDLTGRRRFVSRTVDGAPRSTLAGTAVPSPDGQAAVYAGAVATGDNLRFLDISTGRLQAPVVDRDGSPLAAWLPPDDRRVVTAADRVLRMWDRKDNQLVKVGMGSPSRVTALAATPDGGFVVVGDRAGGVRRMATSDLAAAGPRVVLDHPVTAVAPGPGDTAVALLDDKTYAVVNLADGSVLQRGSLGIKPSAAAVSPDGGRLLVGGSSGEVGLFDLGAQEWIAAPVVGHRQIVDSVSFAGDGATAVTSSFDGGVRIWDGATGAPVAGVDIGQDQSPAEATVLPDGHHALVATRDGAVYQLDTRFDRWTAFACALAGRNLTPAEWRATFGDQPYRETCPTG